MLIKSLNTGVILEHSPEQEVTFTIDNPIFEDDRLPVAVSTGIEFPPTPINKVEFGFVEAMLLAPTVQKLPVAIIVAGIEIFTGELQFDEYSDGTLKYTFVGVGADKILPGKIYEVPSSTYDGIEMKEFIKNARKEYYQDFKLPQIIRQPNSAKVEYATDTAAADCSIIDKYVNYLYSDLPYLVPVVSVQWLLGKIIPGVPFSPGPDFIMAKLGVVAPYKPASWNNDYFGVPYTSHDAHDPTTGRYRINKISDFRPTEGLPDISNREFLSNLLKMFCATMFIDGNSYRIIENIGIIDSTDFVDWTDKVAELYSVVAGEESGYSLAYANENSSYTPSKVDDLGQAEIDPAITTCDNYYQMIDKFRVAANYINVQIASTRNIYSGKQIKARLYYHYEGRKGVVYNTHVTLIPTMDIVYQAGIEKKVVNKKSDDFKMYENNIGFQCVKCVPAAVATPIREGTTDSQVTMYNLSPVIEFPTVGAERPTSVYIGLVYGTNMLDQGNYFSNGMPYVSAGLEDPQKYSLAIVGEKGLYELYHKKFAEWLIKKKDTIKADIFLSPADVAGLRLWQKVMIYNRVFIIKTIEITISDNTDIVFANAEFIEV